MEKRKRRTLEEIRAIRDKALEKVLASGEITLSALVSRYGRELGVKESASDKNLVKKQLDRLASSGKIEFVKAGRNLVAKTVSQDEGTSLETLLDTPLDLAVVRAYAMQLEEVARTLQAQIRTLVRMLEKASR